MKLKGKWFEKKVDERQEMDLLMVEHYGFWLMFYMLLAAILIQTFFLEDGFKMAKAEWIILMVTSLVCVLGWAWKGVWNYQNRKIPGIRTCLLYSIGISVGLGILFGILFALKSDDAGPGRIIQQTGAAMSIMFVITFFVFILIGATARHREKTLAEQNFDDEDDPDDI